MRKHLVSSIAFLGLISAAQAADLAPAPPPVPVFSWTGFYIGANAGYMWMKGNSHSDCVSPGGVLFLGLCQGVFGSRDESGWLAGGQIGYNYQFRGWGGGSWVFGVEADYQFSDVTRSVASNGPFGIIGGVAVPGTYL